MHGSLEFKISGAFWFSISLFFSKYLDNVGNKRQPVDSHGLAMGPQFIVSHLVENGFNVESNEER